MLIQMLAVFPLLMHMANAGTYRKSIPLDDPGKHGLHDVQHTCKKDI